MVSTSIVPKCHLVHAPMFWWENVCDWHEASLSRRVRMTGAKGWWGVVS